MPDTVQPIQIGQIWKEDDKRIERYVRVLDHTVTVVKIVTVDKNGQAVKGARETYANRVRFGEPRGYKLYRDLKGAIHS